MSQQYDQWLFVGCFTQGEAPALQALRFRSSDGALARHGQVADGPYCCLFVRTDPQQRWLLATDRVDTCDGVPGGAVYAYAIDKTSGKLSFINRQPSHGLVPCYIDIHRSGRWAVVGNHGGGSVAVLPIDDAGRLGAATDVVRHEPLQPGQRPRVHCCIFDPSHAFVIAADRGTDQLVVYRFDASTGRLARLHALTTDAGEDPRHLVFAPNGRFVYAITERGNKVLAMRWHADRADLELLQSESSLPPGYEGKNAAADLHIHPSGRFLYGSNRGHESIAIFAIDEDGAKLRLLGHEPTRGNFPRGFTIDPTGRWLLVGNDKSDRLDVFEINQSTGKLAHTGNTLELSRPAALRLILHD